MLSDIQKHFIKLGELHRFRFAYATTKEFFLQKPINVFENKSTSKMYRVNSRMFFTKNKISVLQTNSPTTEHQNKFKQ